MKKFGSLLVITTIFLTGCGPSFEFKEISPRPEAPKSVEVASDVKEFLRDLGRAYGSKDGAAIEKFLSKDFVYQGMNRAAYLRHLAENSAYFDAMEIRPISVAQQDETLKMVAYGITARGPLAPSLNILPLNAGATLIKEAGQWRLRGNQNWNEQGLLLQFTGITGTYPPASLDAYRKLIPQGWELPDEPSVQLNVVEWQSMLPPQTPYRLVQLNILIKRDERNAWFYVDMPATDWLAVEAGKALGFPNSVAEIAIDTIKGKGWQAQVKRAGTELMHVHFSPENDAFGYLRHPPRDGVIVAPDGSTIVTYNQPLGQGRMRSQPGYMTVSHVAPGLWQSLLPMGTKVPAAIYHYDKALKLVIPPLARPTESVATR